MQMWRYIVTTITLCAVVGYAGETNSTQPLKVQQTTKSNAKIVIGRLENVKIIAVDITKKARIDTGATTTSIDARQMERFQRNGIAWIRFTFEDEPIEAPIVREVAIKRHGGKPIRRPVVELELKLGKVIKMVEVTLTNREKYSYPILIGRNFLKKSFMVDVSRAFVGCSNKQAKVL